MAQISALKCSDIVNETEMNNICIVPTRCLLLLAEKGVGEGGGGGLGGLRASFQHYGIKLPPINSMEPASKMRYAETKALFFFFYSETVKKSDLSSACESKWFIQRTPHFE